jgi:hypothetical protein
LRADARLAYQGVRSSSHFDQRLSACISGKIRVTNVLLSDFASGAIIIPFVQEFWPAGFGGKLAGQANLKIDRS